jgi:predicted enzyme related to lactoylglutathione lyase
LPANIDLDNQTKEVNMSSSIAWFEVPAADTRRARDFYAHVFGWSFEPFGDDDYHMAQDAGGAVHAAPVEDGLLTYFRVDDIDAVLRRIRESGGDVIDQQDVPGVGRYAQCRDSEGNRFGVVEEGASE